MKTLLAASTFGLTTLVLVLATTRHVSLPPRHEAPAAEPLQASAASDSAPPDLPRPREAQLAPPIASPGRFTSWRDLESSDGPTFVANLRAFGCPESIVRDLALGFVRNARRAQSDTGAADTPAAYWDPRFDLGPVRETDRTSTRATANEAAVVEELVGPAQSLAAPASFADDASQALHTDGILQAKADFLRSWKQRYDDRIASLLSLASPGGELDEAQQEALHEILRERDYELGQQLDPAELEEFDLRHSGRASGLRLRLEGATVSEQQFRALYRAQKQLDDDLARTAAGEGSLEEAAIRRQFYRAVDGILDPATASRFHGEDSARSTPAE